MGGEQRLYILGHDDDDEKESVYLIACIFAVRLVQAKNLAIRPCTHTLQSGELKSSSI